MTTIETLDKLVRSPGVRLRVTSSGMYELRFLGESEWGWVEPTLEGAIEKAATFMQLERYYGEPT